MLTAMLNSLTFKAENEQKLSLTPFQAEFLAQKLFKPYLIRSNEYTVEETKDRVPINQLEMRGNVT
jgi:hypothetical protein